MELITGAQSQSMKIHVHDERGTKLFDLDDDSRTLGSYNVQSKMILQVEETNLFPHKHHIYAYTHHHFDFHINNNQVNRVFK